MEFGRIFCFLFESICYSTHPEPNRNQQSCLSPTIRRDIACTPGADKIKSGNVDSSLYSTKLHCGLLQTDSGRLVLHCFTAYRRQSRWILLLIPWGERLSKIIAYFRAPLRPMRVHDNGCQTLKIDQLKRYSCSLETALSADSESDPGDFA